MLCRCSIAGVVWTTLFALGRGEDPREKPKLAELRLLAASPSPLPQMQSELLTDRESADSMLLLDPEDLADATTSSDRLKRLVGRGDVLPGSMASPSPQPTKPMEELMRTERGVLLSTPLSAEDRAKAMAEAAATKCTNSCESSYDGVCSDGATSEAFCTRAEPFAAVGRGACAVAESSDCEL